MTTIDDPQGAAWERQPGETDPAWEAFTTYRDQGSKRSTAKVASTLGKSETLIHRWSSRWDWVRRCHAWSIEQDRLWAVEIAQQRRIVARRTVAHANLAAAKAVEALQSARNITVTEAIRLLEFATTTNAKLYQLWEDGDAQPTQAITVILDPRVIGSGVTPLTAGVIDEEIDQL